MFERGGRGNRRGKVKTYQAAQLVLVNSSQCLVLHRAILSSGKKKSGRLGWGDPKRLVTILGDGNVVCWRRFEGLDGIGCSRRRRAFSSIIRHIEEVVTCREDIMWPRALSTMGTAPVVREIEGQYRVEDSPISKSEVVEFC